MPSKALETFITTHNRGRSIVERSIKLYRIANHLQSDPTIDQYNDGEFISDAGRSGIVTVVAAFDRYFTTRFSECVVPILKKEGPSDGLLKILSAAGLDLKGALSLLHMQRPHRRIRALVDDHFSDYTTQKFHVIDDLFKSIGILSLTENAEKKARKKRLRVSIERLVRRRHVIVHAGDVDRRGNLRDLDPYDSLKRIDNVKILIERADEIIENRLRRCR